MIGGHACNAYCSGDEHCDLVYTREAVSLDQMAVVYEWCYGVRVLRMAPAHEAPPLASLPWEEWAPLTATAAVAKAAGRAEDRYRWLVWWRSFD